MTTRKQRIEGPALTRSNAFRADSIASEDERRVRVSFSSDAPVMRSSFWDEPWIEVLGHDENEILLDRINSGAPVLYNHSRDGSSRIGVIERAWVENGRGMADIRLSRRAEVDGIWQDVRDNVLCNVSVGYQIHERTLIKANDDAPDEYLITRWSPMEISLVDVPADYTVGVGRAEENSAAVYRITDLPEATGATQRDMQTMTDKAAGQAPRATTEQEKPSADSLAEARREALEQERARRAAIRLLCEPLRARHEFISDMENRALESDTTADDLGKAILRKMGETAQPLAADPQPDARGGVIQSGADARDKFLAGASQAILVRAATPGLPADMRDMTGNEFRGLRLLDLARHSLNRAGHDTRGMSQKEIVGRAFTLSGSDFPVLMENTMHKAMSAGYQTAAITWPSWAKRGSVVDFRIHNRYAKGLLGRLKSLNEAGELKTGSIPDVEKQTIQAATKGLIIPLTRNAIINDELGAFADVGPDMGAAAARTVEYDAIAALVSNPTLNDGIALFHSSHGNLASSGAAIGVDTLDAARVAMGSQKDPAGEDILDIRPSVLLCTLAAGGGARVVIGSEYDPDATSKLQRPNKVRQMVSNIIDTGRLSGTAWYLLANPQEHPVVEVAFLDGDDQPQLEEEMGFTTDGVRWRVLLDYAVGAVGWRGAWKNPGA